MNKILITGGAGFIGSNTAMYFGKKNWDVTIIDNLSRKNSEKNLSWIRSLIDINFYNLDVRDYNKLYKCINEVKPNFIIHLAAQVAVTTAIDNPRLDFEVNAIGTFNILEIIRLSNRDIYFINASTNKVYGELKHHKIININNKYQYDKLKNGISENNKIDFYSPYGCSKGIGEQYTIDYSRIYGLKTMSFRKSCVYGERQFGVEEQGWVAWFCIAAYFNKHISIFGDGMQVRDVLYINDLIHAYELAYQNKEKIFNGEVFNIGGGNQNTLSLLELLFFLSKKLNKEINYNFFDWRKGDQKIYISDISKIEKDLKWRPHISVNDGLNKLINWIDNNKVLFL
jgi:CDP-paratose 2-epimerase